MKKSWEIKELCEMSEEELNSLDVEVFLIGNIWIPKQAMILDIKNMKQLYENQKEVMQLLYYPQCIKIQ